MDMHFPETAPFLSCLRLGADGVPDGVPEVSCAVQSLAGVDPLGFGRPAAVASSGEKIFVRGYKAVSGPPLAGVSYDFSSATLGEIILSVIADLGGSVKL